MSDNLNHSLLFADFHERTRLVRRYIAQQCDGRLGSIAVVGRRAIAFTFRWHIGSLRAANDNSPRPR